MKKTFDCVELKIQMQAKLREQEAALGASEARRKRQQWLATGDDELARWWRSLAVVTESHSLVVREDPVEYGTQSGKDTTP